MVNQQISVIHNDFLPKCFMVFIDLVKVLLGITSSFGSADWRFPVWGQKTGYFQFANI